MNHGIILRVRTWLSLCLLGFSVVPIAHAGTYYINVYNSSGSTATNVSVEWRPNNTAHTGPGSWSYKLNNGNVFAGATNGYSQTYSVGGYHLEWRVTSPALGAVIYEGVDGGYVTVQVGGPPPDTYYTNTFTWKNQSLIPLYVVATGNHPRFPETFTAGGNQTYNWTFITTNIAGWMAVDEFDGPYHADLTPSSVTTNTYSLVKPTVPGTNILFQAGSTAATDETLQQGFNTLYSAINEASEANSAALQQMTLSVTNVNNNNVTNLNSVTNINNVSITNTGDGAALATLVGISNMMALSGGGEEFSNAVPWQVGADATAATMEKGQTESEAVREQIGEAVEIFGPFGKLGGLTVPDMTIESSWSLAPFSIDCDPMSNGTLYQIAAWCRQFLKWIATFYFVWWAIGLILRKFNNFAKAGQFAMSGVLGKVGSAMTGMGALVPALTVLLPCTVFAAGAAVMGGWFSEFATGHATFLANLATSPIEQDSLPHIALYLFDCFVPWDYFLMLLEAAVIWWLYVEAGYLAVVFALKFAIKFS